MLWLAVAFPDLGLAVHTRAQPPGTPSRPLALVAEGRVRACNPEAAAAGVAPGQRTASAVALCPPLRFLEAQPAAEARLLRQLAEACLAVTPTVVLAPPHTVLLEVEGCLQLFHGRAGLLRQLQRGLRPFAVPWTLAQAPTPKAALALVMAGLGHDALALPLPLTARTCQPLLAQVPVSALPWPPELQKKLAALQLPRLGDLLALPRPALSKRLGTAATRYLAQLTGEWPDPQTPLRVAEDFQSTLFFLDGISHAEGLRFPMKRLLEDFCRFLRQRQWACARFSWRFGHQDRSRQQLVIASARGEPQAARLLQLSELKLEHFRISAPVESVTLVATEFQPLGDTRLALLPEPGQEDAQALELLDRLRARLGADACRRVVADSTHLPERAQRLVAEGGAAAPLAAPPADPAARPFWLWPDAKALRIVDGRLWWQGAFTLLSRPERIALPWWEDGDTRDYYLARHDNGAHYWVYFSRAAQAWFCQGLFG